jgi:capsid protein
MSILDPYGRKVAWKAARGAQNDGFRPYEPVERQDIDKLIPAIDRVTLASHANRIYINLPPLRNAVAQRGMYAVGRAWLPEFRGVDTNFGNSAKEWLTEQFYKIGDVRGGMNDFRSNLFVWSKSIDVDGEVFILLTETETGYPQYQGIPQHRIRTPQNMADGDKMRGGTLKDGIIHFSSGAAKEYAFCDTGGSLIEWIPASNMIHLYEPEWQYQGRGISGLTSCINDCRDIIQSNEWERLAMMQMSAISMVEYNEHGGPDPDDPYASLVADGEVDNGMTVKSLDGGTVRYFKSNSGGKIEVLKNTRPGDAVLKYHDRLLKSAYSALSWPFAFYQGHVAGGGTAQRTEIAMAQRSIDDRQDLLSYAVNRIIGYAVAKAQKRGDLPKSNDWYKWTFSTPPKLTIDDGRVMKELEMSWKMGTLTHRDILGKFGKNLEDHYEERAEETALRKLAAMRAQEKYNVPVSHMEMALLTANEIFVEDQKEKKDDETTNDSE